MYKWLEERGFLEDHITEEQLEDGKKIYKRCYNREYQKKRRKELPTVRVVLTKDQYQRFREDAEKNTDKRKQHVATSIKEHALANLDKRYRVPNQNQILDLIEGQQLIVQDIRRIRDKVIHEDLPSAEYLNFILDHITKLTEYTRAKLGHPEEVITK